MEELICYPNTEEIAMSYAINAHSSVNHTYDDSPYSIHLIMVVQVAKKYIKSIIPTENINDVICACWLHDTIEDCRLTYNDIKKEFGENVAEIVYAVSNEKGKNRKERANDRYYRGIRNTDGATFVKMCDRLANITYPNEVGCSFRNRKSSFPFLSTIISGPKLPSPTTIAPLA